MHIENDKKGVWIWIQVLTGSVRLFPLSNLWTELF